MSEQIARFKPGENLPALADSLVHAGRFVQIAGDKSSDGDYVVEEASADVWVLGVSQRDSADPSDSTNFGPHATELRIEIVGPGAVARVETSEALNAGNAVASDSGGKAKLQDASEVIVGYAMADCDQGDFAEVRLV